jgi:beta-phosphoglucomutase-like phosphatase (HAD superfamily)
MSGWHAAYDAIVERDGLALKPGVARLFDVARRARASRAPSRRRRGRERAQAKLEHAALWTRIDALVGGDEVARGKAAPTSSSRPRSRLGVPAGMCVVLEDSEAGVLGRSPPA